MTLVWQWTALSRAGFRREGIRLAPSRLACLRALEQDRLWPLAIRLDLSRSLRELSRRGPRRLAVAESFGYMADLLGLGIPLARILEDGAATTRDRALAAALRETVERVRKGERLSRAMEATGAFRPIAVSSIIAAEQTGTLAEAFAGIAAAARQDAELIARIRKAAGYPAFVAALGLLIGSFIAVAVLPRIAQALGGLTTLPPLTRAVLAAGHISQPLALGVLAALGPALAALALWYRANPVGAWHLVWWLPLLGPALKEGLLARFLGNVSVFLRNGFPVLDALDGGRRGLGNPALDRAVERVLGRVRNGRGLAGALADPLFPPLIRMAAARGEETGKTEKYLDEAARLLSRQMVGRIERLTTWIERSLLLGVAGFILFLALAFLLPIYGGLQQMTPYR